MITVDFETEAIGPRPQYPPKPVGVAIKYPGKPGKYLHWGHHDSTDDQTKAFYELRYIWNLGKPILMHNAKFDLDVAEVHFGLKPPPWDLVHDTLFTLYLHDPHAQSLGLKPSAERYLGQPPKERDAVREWLIAHRVVPANAADETFGASISKAPASVVGPYAIGDVERTLALHKLLHPKLDSGMRKAYDRERRLLPIMLGNERQGLRVDVETLARDLRTYEAALTKVEDWLRTKLKNKNLNFDNDQEVGDALFRAKIVTDWVWTKGGKNRAPQRSVAKANLGPERFRDPIVAAGLGYRTRLHTVLANSMRPWLQSAQSTGFIYTEWNQVRHHQAGKSKGTRTGRISCSRFMNVSKNFLNKGDGYEHPAKLGLPELPLVRHYVLPDKGHVWRHRDFHQQEFRILAHFEDGDLLKTYQRAPWTDYHENVRSIIRELGYADLAKVDRVIIKNFNFGILYGEGVALLAVNAKMTLEKAAQFRAAVKRATPGVKALDDELKRRGRCGEPIRTWGGRLYYCEPPSIAKKGARKGQEVTWEYKLLNYLVQGSAADATKEAIIRYHDIRKEGRMLVTIHDEVNVSVPPRAQVAEDKRLAKAMESVEFDVPLLTEAKQGPAWGRLEKIK